MEHSPRIWKPAVHLGLAFMSLLWGLVFVAIKIGGREMPIEVFNADRFILGVIMLAVVTWKTGCRQRVTLSMALELTALGLLGHGFMQIAFAAGIMRTDASVSALIYGCTPLIVALLSAMLRLESLRAIQWVGLLLAAAGMAAVVLSGRDIGGVHNFQGPVLVGVATLMMAVYTVWSRRIVAAMDLMFMTTWVLGVGAIVMAIWSAPKQAWALYQSMSLKGWLIILYGAVFALVVPNLIYLWGVREIGRSRTAVFVNAVPLIGCVAGWLLLDENIKATQAGGAVLILAGIYLAQANRWRMKGCGETIYR